MSERFVGDGRLRHSGRCDACPTVGDRRRNDACRPPARIAACECVRFGPETWTFDRPLEGSRFAAFAGFAGTRPKPRVTTSSFSRAGPGTDEGSAGGPSALPGPSEGLNLGLLGPVRFQGTRTLCESTRRLPRQLGSCTSPGMWPVSSARSVSYTHLTLPTKRIV